MILLIDNYDSFTYNLVHLLGALGAEPVVRRNDEISAAEATGPEVSALILSPGPKTPNAAGVCLEAVRAAPARLPILGVCLGHQTIAQAHGGVVGPARRLRHGKVDRVRHWGDRLFAETPAEFEAARYHSLAVRRETLPDALEIIAESDDGEIMALRHRVKPQVGVQFHPESVASPDGARILRGFLAEVGART